MSKMNLTEATMLALQGKLDLKESRLPRKRAKKTENIDVNVDDKTSVSVSEDVTVVETEEATIVVSEHNEEIAPVEDVAVPEEVIAIDEPVEVVEVPVESDETIIPEEIIDEPVDTILPDEPVEEPVELEATEPEEETEEQEVSEDEEEIEESKEVEEDKEKIEESLASDGADEIEHDDRYENAGYGHYNVFLARYIADTAEALGDDYSEWLDRNSIEEIIDAIKEDDGAWESLNNAVRDAIEDKVDWIRRDDPASRYYEGPIEESKLEEVSSEGVYSLQEIIVSELKNIKRLGGYIPGSQNGAIAGEYLKTLDDTKLNELAQNLAEDDNNEAIFNAYHNFMFLLENKIAEISGLVLDKKATKLESYKVEESEDYNPAELDEEITVYDVNEFVKSKFGVDYNTFDYSTGASILVGETGECCIVDDEAVGIRCANTSEEFKLGIVDAKTDGGIPIFPQYQAKVKVQDIIDNAPSKTMKMRDFFTRYNYNSRCVENFRELLDYLKQINFFKKEEVAEEPKTENKKFSSKTFESAMSKYFKAKYKTVESVEVTKVARKSDAIKVEAKLVNADNISKDICLEMKQIQTNGKFTKYELVESKGLLKENKQDTSKLIMTTCNNNSVLECKYLISK